MQKDYLRITIFVLTAFPLMVTAEDACYPAGGVAGIVIATIVVTAVVIGLGLAAAWKFWKRKKVRNKGPENSHKPGNEKIPGDFAFDNPYFRDQEDDETDAVKQGKARSSINKSPLRSSKQSDLSSKGKKTRSGKGHFIFGGGGQGKKQRAMDDSCLAVEPERSVVSLRGHDFTGLGFNICGNMRDGILVKDVLHRGPASESGKIKAGDRIISVTVSFTNIVYEDALTILSYASPYDVQLELERMAASEKARSAMAVGESPSSSKRLGSCSFSSSGPKLFHPLYRSQSIDDLTQIDRDTFPSHHGFGPRRSQSVGVAAHKLASHFKNSDSRLAEEDKKKKDGRNPGAVSVILSTTGSLNEKMLANVMADGALNKSGGLLHWEKRFEDTLENDDSTGLEPPTKNKTISSSSTSNDDSMDEIITSGYRNKFQRSKCSSKRNSKRKQDDDLRQRNYEKHDNYPQSGADLKTSVQVHRSDNMKEKISESTGEVWQLNQSNKINKNSDLDTSETCPWNNKSQSKLSTSDKSPPFTTKENNEKNRIRRNIIRNCEEDSDVSGDSLENGKKHRSKHLTKHKTSSLEDMTQFEDAVNNHVNHGHYNKNVLNFGNEKTSNGSYQKNTVKNFANESTQDNLSSKHSTQLEKTQSLSQSQYANSSVAQLCNKEKRLERAVMNTAHSPRLSVRSQKSKCDSNDNLFSKPIAYSNAIQMEDSPKIPIKLNDKTGYHERQNQNCSRVQGYQVSNNLNSPKGDMEGNKIKGSAQSSKQHAHQLRRTQLSNYQKQSQPRQISDDQEIKMSDTRSTPLVTGYTQILRKNVNPAGMFTQINPFQQASRSKNNINSQLPKSWVSKEQPQNSLPVNGNDFRCHPQYSKNVPITSTDSSTGRSRARMNLNAPDTQNQSQKVLDGSNSKTVLISTYDHSNNTPSSNFRQMRN